MIGIKYWQLIIIRLILRAASFSTIQTRLRNLLIKSNSKNNRIIRYKKPKNQMILISSSLIKTIMN